MNIRATFVNPLFDGLKWYEASEYTLLMVLVVALPIQWHIALWCLILLCANTLVKIIATRHIGNPTLGCPIRACLCLMMLFYAVYALSGIYSSQPAEALSTASTMLPLLLFPLIFLLSDTHYLRRRRLSTLSYLLAATLTVRFVIMIFRSAFHSIDTQLYTGTTGIIATLIAQLSAWFSQITPFQHANNLIGALPLRAIANILHSMPLSQPEPYEFDPLHHNYLALYILTAIALLYNELIHHWHSPRWHKVRWFVIADMGLLSAYILFSDSRSGIVAWVLLVLACFVHLAFGKRQWRTIGIILAVSALVIGISYWASPKTYDRITDTANNLLSGEKGDIRQTMWQSGLQTVKQRPIFGYGCDGYWNTLFDQYREQDCLDASVLQFSTHNQYLETTLATGLVGMAVMLAMMLAPVLLSLRRPHRNLPMLLFTVAYAVCIFFEATFGRQMGLLFIGLWYCLLLHYSCPTSSPSPST